VGIFRPNFGWVLCLAIAGFFLWAGAQWIHEHRVGGLVDADEAVFFAIAIYNYFVLAKDGVVPWLAAIAGPIQGPVTMVLATLVYGAAGLELHYGFYVPLALASVAILATFVTVKHIAGSSTAVAAAALTATVPQILTYSRDFHLSMSATAVLALAVMAAVKSDRFSKTGWSIAFGVFVGLLPLSRTMAIAFVPGILLGVTLNIVSSADRGPRVLRAVVALGIAMLSASTWLAFTWKEVFGYLIGWGYGSHALEYGRALPFLSIDTLRRALEQVAHALFYIHFVLIAAGLLLGMLATCRILVHGGWNSVGVAARSPLIVLASTVFFGFAALMSSPNVGTAFVAPLLPPLVALAVCSAWFFLDTKLYRSTVAVVCVVAAGIVASPFLGVYAVLPKQKVTTLPLVGFAALSDDRGVIDFYIDATGRIGRDREGAARWRAVFVRTNDAISAQDENAHVANGFRHSLYHPTQLSLDYLLRTGRRRGFIPPDPVYSGNTVDGYRTWLSTGSAASAKLLLTSPGSEGEPQPFVDNAAIEEAARGLAFVPVDTWAMPNGRQVTLWKRSEPRP